MNHQERQERDPRQVGAQNEQALPETRIHYSPPQAEALDSLEDLLEILGPAQAGYGPMF